MNKQWQERHPDLVKRIRANGPELERIQTMIIEQILDEMEEPIDDFRVAEFLERSYYRLLATNTITQMFQYLAGNY